MVSIGAVDKRAASYLNAGKVEFLIDHDENYYFMERKVLKIDKDQ